MPGGALGWLQPSFTLPSSFFRTLIVIFVPSANVASFEFRATMEPPPLKSTLIPGNFATGSFAATLIAPTPVDGEPAMYSPGPLLPTDATTMIPAFAALVAATADGSSAVPNGDPSDMLITSMS